MSAADSMAATRRTDATAQAHNAISHALEAAANATSSSGSERVRNLPALALIEAREIAVHAALLSLAEHLERFNTDAEDCTEVDQHITALVTVLDISAPARGSSSEGWALRRRKGCH